MLVVMALIAIALGTLSVPLFKILRKEKFERGIEQIITKIVLAQELMLDFRTDVELIFIQNGQSIDCHIETAHKLPLRLEQAINRFGKIQGIDQMVFNERMMSKISLHFNGSMGSTPQGTLKFIAQDQEKIIALQGYPAQVKRGHCESKNLQADYPEEIFSII